MRLGGYLSMQQAVTVWKPGMMVYDLDKAGLSSIPLLRALADGTMGRRPNQGRLSCRLRAHKSGGHEPLIQRQAAAEKSERAARRRERVARFSWSLLGWSALLLAIGLICSGCCWIGLARVNAQKTVYEKGRAMKVQEQATAKSRREWLVTREYQVRLNPGAMLAVRLPHTSPSPTGNSVSARPATQLARSTAGPTGVGRTQTIAVAPGAGSGNSMSSAAALTARNRSFRTGSPPRQVAALSTRTTQREL